MNDARGKKQSARSRAGGVAAARKARAALIASLALIANLSLSSCAESTAGGEPVPIPRVFINCPNGNCKTTPLPAFRVTVLFTTSGCLRSDFGGTISGASGETSSLSCNPTSGCYGEITSWINAAGQPVTTIPSGTYSLCARIDYNGDYPASQAGDSYGVLDNVAVGTTTANQFITSWSDL